MSVSIPLEVPEEDNDEVEALGGRWDPACRLWWAPAEDLAAYERWLPEWHWVDSPSIPTVPAEVVSMGTRCWLCSSVVSVVAGARANGGGGRFFVSFDDLAPFLVSQVDPAVLAAHGIGPIRWRHSRPRPEGYLANGCACCDAMKAMPPAASVTPLRDAETTQLTQR
jgi:uncharacterized protein DUF5710